MLAADGGGGGGTPSGSWLSGMDSLGQQMTDFANAAKQGQFSVNDAGGKALLGAIQEMQNWLRGEFRQQQHEGRFGKQYGATHGASVVEPYMNSVMNDADGLMPMLERFQTVLQDAADAIKKAMENYQQSDSDAKASLPDAGGDVSVSPSAPRVTPAPYTPPADSGGPQVVNI